MTWPSGPVGSGRRAARERFGLGAMRRKREAARTGPPRRCQRPGDDKLHEPRPFCFFWFGRGTAAAACAELDECRGGSGVAALAEAS